MELPEEVIGKISVEEAVRNVTTNYRDACEPLMSEETQNLLLQAVETCLQNARNLEGVVERLENILSIRNVTWKILSSGQPAELYPEGINREVLQGDQEKFMVEVLPGIKECILNFGKEIAGIYSRISERVSNFSA
jgi:hypothetical protein